MQSISDNVDADVSQLNLSTGRAKQFSKDSIELEGGSKRGAKKKDEEKDDKEAKLTAQMVKDTFHQTNIVGTQHLQKMNVEMGKHGSKEKTGFMEKEAEFIKNLKEVQEFHLLTCKRLLQVSNFALFVEFVWAAFCVFYFGCGVGDCENGLVCSLYYIKLAQTLFLINTYMGNIKENQPNHPVGTLNTFIVVLLYYICLYQYMDELNSKEDPKMVHFCVLFVVLDLLLIIISLFAIKKVKIKSSALIENERFKEYT